MWIIITVLCLFFWGRGRLQWLLLAWQVDSRPRVVDEPEGRLWADSHGFHYFETSAQTGEGIGDMFQVWATSSLFIIHESVWKLFICRWHTRFASMPQAFEGCSCVVGTQDLRLYRKHSKVWQLATVENVVCVVSGLVPSGGGNSVVFGLVYRCDSTHKECCLCCLGALFDSSVA